MSLELTTAGLRAVTFVAAIFAALVAAQLYNLIKSSDVARAWRSFIVGALVFAVWALASFANTFFGFLFEEGRNIAAVMDLLQALFIGLYAAGLWQLRQLHFHPDRLRPLKVPGQEAGDGELEAGEQTPLAAEG